MSLNYPYKPNKLATSQKMADFKVSQTKDKQTIQFIPFDSSCIHKQEGDL